MTVAPKATPLNTVHREMGARMVDFGGWDMPLHYGSQLEEHHRVRRDCGMFDVSHMLVIDVRGGGSRALLSCLLRLCPTLRQKSCCPAQLSPRPAFPA